MTPKPAPNGALVYRLLSAHPYPVASDLRLSLDGVCRFGLDGVTWCFRDDGWHVLADTFAHHLPAADHVTAKLLHAEIGRVRALVDGEPSPTWAEIKADCVGPDLPTKSDRMSPGHLGGDLLAHPFPGAIDLRLTTDGLHFTVGDITLRYDGEAFHAPRHRVESTLPHPAAINAQGVHAEIHRVLAIVMGARMSDAEQAFARVTDAHAVVSQRLAGSQKEVAEVSAERDEATARATKAEARVKRLRKSINAAHAVLDEAGIGLEVEGSPRWTLARRCRAAVEPVWGYLDALQAFDVVGESVGVTGKTGERGFMDAVIARVKALHQEDTDLLRLVNYHQAPVTFNARPLTLAERASFVIRRLWQGRANAANEAASLRRELGDIEAALGDLPDTAEREPIGDREEHLGLSTAERIRLSR